MSPSASEWRITTHPASSSLALKGLPMNPEAPVTRTVLLIREKLPSVLFKLVDGPFVIVRPADIEPVAAVRFDVDRFTPRLTRRWPVRNRQAGRYRASSRRKVRRGPVHPAPTCPA